MAKERRELRQAQANQLIDNMPKDLNRPWEDPMPDAGERLFTQVRTLLCCRSIALLGAVQMSGQGCVRWHARVAHATRLACCARRNDQRRRRLGMSGAHASPAGASVPTDAVKSPPVCAEAVLCSALRGAAQ
jgi:hypothetical protein